MSAQGLLRCTAGSDRFAIRAADVRHIARAEQIRADDTGDGRAGILKLGSQNVPVFCLRSALGLDVLDAAPVADRHVAVTGDQQRLVGWLVDRITREARAATAIAPLPEVIGGNACRWFAGVALGEDEPMLLLNPRHLNPVTADSDDEDDATAMFSLPPLPAPVPAEPVALVFSTAALPSSGVDKFALSGRQVAAIVPTTAAIAVPGSASHVSGLTMWRDAAVPIIDFTHAATGDGRDRRRLIARCARDGGRSLVAMTIDADVLMHRPAADNRLLTDAACPPFANGVFELNGDRVALLDLDAMLSAA